MDKGSVAASGWHFALPCNLTKALRFRVNQVTTNVTRVTSNNTVKLNQWQHVAVTFASSTQTIVAQDIHIYVDGVETTYQTNTDGSGARDDDSAQSVRIGSSSSGNFFDGLIDEVRVYNRALTEAEIRQLYKAGSSFHPNVTNKSTIRDGLVGHWTFDGADMGTTSARDASGNANTGWLVNGAKKTIGKIGQALNFDGSNDYVNLGDVLNLSLPATISMWIKPNTLSSSSANQGLISTDKDNNSFHSGISSQVNTTGTLGVSFGSNTACSVTSRQTKTSTNTLTANNWSHVVFVVVGASNMNIYINNVDAGGTYSGTGGGIVNTTRTAEIGLVPDCGGSADNYFKGLIDEVRVYNRALSPAEIKRLYNMGR